jgi:hypothetical protein
VTHPDISGQHDTLELMNQELAARLDRQDQSGSKIDTKAALLAGFIATAAPFLATRHGESVLEGFAFAAYAVAFGLAVAALAIAPYKEVKPRGLLDGYAMRSKQEALAYLAAARVRIFEQNKQKYERKSALWWYSLAALAIGLVFSVAAIVQTGGHGSPQGPRQHSTSALRSTD